MARGLFLALALIFGTASLGAATYRVGDSATNFSFVARKSFTRPDGTLVPAGAPVRLADFTGRIVFFEWFAVWCPYCVAAAPQVESGIVDWYAARNGNPSGIPVLHVAVNQEPASFYQSQTSSFVESAGFGIVVNDYDNVSTNRVRFLFQTSGQPIFVAINGVTNSPSHRPWQVLVNHLGYGDRDFSQELVSFRAAIDAVQAPAVAPVLTGARRVGAELEFAIQTQAGRAYRLQSSTNLTEWSTVRTVTGTNAPILIREPIGGNDRRFYRAVSP